MQYKTRDLNEAGVLWAQNDFQVSLDRLEPVTDKDGVFNFVFKCEAEPDVIEGFLSKYINQEIKIEPKTYDQKLNNLRDRLRKVRIK
jgi:hypothetical protein